MWWQDDGSWWEDQSWFETAQVWNDSWNESWDCAWQEGQENWDESWSWPAIEDQQPSASAGGMTQGVQYLVLSPLISDIFGAFSTSLTLETEISDVFDDVCSHFSTNETVFHVPIAGLQCLESNRLFCTCQNCMTISDDFAANLECCQLRNVRLRHFWDSLPPACFISEPDFFINNENSFLFQTLNLQHRWNARHHLQLGCWLHWSWRWCQWSWRNTTEQLHGWYCYVFGHASGYLTWKAWTRGVWAWEAEALEGCWCAQKLPDLGSRWKRHLSLCLIAFPWQDTTGCAADLTFGMALDSNPETILWWRRIETWRILWPSTHQSKESESTSDRWSLHCKPLWNQGFKTGSSKKAQVWLIR